MRAKELKRFLANIPDDTEILIRCQNHERPPMGSKETISIVSVTPILNDYVHQVVLNPEKSTRLSAWTPDLTEFVSCEDCVRASRIKTCAKRGRVCETCSAVCDCKDCFHSDIAIPKPYSEKCKFERNLNR